jgi:hypothetical protein
MPRRKLGMPEMTHAEVIRNLQLRIEEAGSDSAAARLLGVSRDLIGKVMHGQRTVSPKLLRALHLRRVAIVAYRYEPCERGPWRRSIRLDLMS